MSTNVLTRPSRLPVQLLFKCVAGALLLLMLVFIGVQWNDPDGLLWAVIYGLPAVLMLIVVMRPGLLGTQVGRIGLACILVGLLVATILAWPEQPAFWTRDVWWEEETAREGMGLMIALVVSAFALPAALRQTRKLR